MAIVREHTTLNQPTMRPGDWWIQYIGDKPIHFKDQPSAPAVCTLGPHDSLILCEADALAFLAAIQQNSPDALRYFVVIDREPETGVIREPVHAPKLPRPRARLLNATE